MTIDIFEGDPLHYHHVPNPYPYLTPGSLTPIPPSPPAPPSDYRLYHVPSVEIDYEKLAQAIVKELVRMLGGHQ